MNKEIFTSKITDARKEITREKAMKCSYYGRTGWTDKKKKQYFLTEEIEKVLGVMTAAEWNNFLLRHHEQNTIQDIDLFSKL